MKKKEIKTQNYESNEKRMKEEKIWSEFNDSELKPDIYDNTDDDEGVFPETTFSRKNSLQPEFVVKDYDEVNYMPSKSHINPM